MKRFLTFAVAAVLAAGMSTMAWSRSGGGSVGASSFNNPQLRNAFNDSRIRRQLNLSQDQIRQLRALNNSWRQQVQRFQRGAGKNSNSVDQPQWNQMQQQYATMLNDVLTAQQQQALSQLVGQLSTFRPNTMRGPTGPTATRTNRNSSAGTASAGQTSTTGTTAPTFRTSAVSPNQPYRISISNQALGGGGSSAIGTALVNGDPIGLNKPGPTQAHQGGGSSYFGTLLLNAGGP